jgi:hypothetical protein
VQWFCFLNVNCVEGSQSSAAVGDGRTNSPEKKNNQVFGRDKEQCSTYDEIYMTSKMLTNFAKWSVRDDSNWYRTYAAKFQVLLLESITKLFSFILWDSHSVLSYFEKVFLQSLRLWVRIPPGAWMFVCCECCVLSGRGLCDELITRPE